MKETGRRETGGLFCLYRFIYRTVKTHIFLLRLFFPLLSWPEIIFSRNSQALDNGISTDRNKSSI
jgi:hypothetical protein